MSFKDLLGVFVDTGNKQEDKKPDAKKPLTPQMTEKSSTNAIHYDTTPESSYQPSNSNTSGISTDEGEKHFEQLLSDKNQSGTDYYEFEEALKEMNSIPVEESRYTTTFNILRKTGLTKDILVNTANNYISFIDSELQAFNEAFVVQYRQKVEDRQNLIQQKTKQMQDLSDQITALNTEIKDIQKGVTEDSFKLNAKKSGFEAAGNVKKKEIAGQIEKINQYITQ